MSSEISTKRISTTKFSLLCLEIMSSQMGLDSTQTMEATTNSVLDVSSSM